MFWPAGFVPARREELYHPPGEHQPRGENRNFIELALMPNLLKILLSDKLPNYKCFLSFLLFLFFLEKKLRKNWGNVAR